MKTQEHFLSHPELHSFQEAFAGPSVAFFKNDFLALFPEIFLIICTLFLLMYGVHFSTLESAGLSAPLHGVVKPPHRPILTENVGYLSLLTLLFTLILLYHNPFNEGT